MLAGPTTARVVFKLRIKPLQVSVLWYGIKNSRVLSHIHLHAGLIRSGLDTLGDKETTANWPLALWGDLTYFTPPTIVYLAESLAESLADYKR